MAESRFKQIISNMRKNLTTSTPMGEKKNTPDNSENSKKEGLEGWAAQLMELANMMNKAINELLFSAIGKLFGQDKNKPDSNQQANQQAPQENSNNDSQDSNISPTPDSNTTNPSTMQPLAIDTPQTITPKSESIPVNMPSSTETPKETSLQSPSISQESGVSTDLNEGNDTTVGVNVNDEKGPPI